MTNLRCNDQCESDIKSIKSNVVAGAPAGFETGTGGAIGYQDQGGGELIIKYSIIKRLFGI